MSVLAVDGLRVRYGTHLAVDGFSEVVAPGEWLSLIGPNGAGKSSVVRAIAGLVRHEGTVQVDGTSLASLGGRDRARLIAYVPQAPLLPDDMTGAEYVRLGRNPYVGYFGVESADDLHVVDDVLSQLDLTGFARRRLGTLSGGERQRLVVARALAQQAPVLLLDEPTTALDIGHQQQALELVDRLRHERRLTVVGTMHDLTLAGLYADRLVLLDRGRVITGGTAAEVLRPDVLARHYGARASVHRESDGTVVVVPTRR